MFGLFFTPLNQMIPLWAQLNAETNTTLACFSSSGVGMGGSGGGAKCPILWGIKKLPHTQYTITMQQQA